MPTFAQAKHNRKFYDLTGVYSSKDEYTEHTQLADDRVPDEEDNSECPENVPHPTAVRNKLMAYIDHNVIGRNLEFTSPFGTRQQVYCDYTASGKSLQFIENYILTEVLPSYGNTHTTTSVTSLQTTLFRHEARDALRNAVGASEDDAVIFVGSGCTGSVHKLISGLDMKEPPTVFVGASEHHSNLLPWREIASKIIRIEENSDGVLNLDQLERVLKSAGPGNKIGCFSAASNVTGTLNPDLAITSLLHSYGALSFWDYAAAAPYVKLSMNPCTAHYPSGTAHKDAMYFSMHKFIGGVQTPGVLIVKKSLMRNHVPNGSGGGTVFFVGRQNHRYLQDSELREEGGTPAIVESIRAGLVLNLKESVTSEAIMDRDHALVQRAFAKWQNIPELLVLGSQQAPRLPIFSFLIRHPSGFFLHHNFICSLLNDLYGIQARGGCACAGPYAQDLLGIDPELAQRYEDILMEDGRLDRTHLRRKEEHSSYEILRPGFSRLNLAYFASDSEVDFVLSAVADIAKNGWIMLPFYRLNAETGEWHHYSQLSFKDRKWLGYIDYSKGHMRLRHPKRPDSAEAPANSIDCLQKARDIFKRSMKESGPVLTDQRVGFSPEASQLRWFLLPSEAQELLRGTTAVTGEAPFNPRVYSDNSSLDYPLHQYSTIPSNCPAELVATNGEPPAAASQATGDVEDLLEEDENSDSFDTNSFSEDFTVAMHLDDDDNIDEGKKSIARAPVNELWKSPVRSIMKPTLEALNQFKMISNGDRVLVCISGGKDSLSLLHTLHQYQRQSHRFGITFEMGAMTVDPGSSAYDPSPLIPYMDQLGIPYFYERQCIISKAMDTPDLASICSFCSRLKRGRIYATARSHGYNVIALGQHLDDLAESFLMSVLHNGRLRTMKAAYVNQQRDLKIIRPFVYVREKELRQFAHDVHLPVIPENCPACFEAPKERHRIKQLLAQQELLYPHIHYNIKTSLLPLMSINEPFVEKKLFGKQSYIEQKNKELPPPSKNQTIIC